MNGTKTLHTLQDQFLYQHLSPNNKNSEHIDLKNTLKIGSIEIWISNIFDVVFIYLFIMNQNSIMTKRRGFLCCMVCATSQ